MLFINSIIISKYLDKKSDDNFGARFSVGSNLGENIDYVMAVKSVFM
jgi:hypothetical protein